MLRHKKILVTSLYRFSKSLSFCDAKRFHLTRCVLLRKVGPTKKTLPESDSFTKTVGEFHVEPNSNTNNFYGIESDEGVIDIEQRSRNIKPEQDLFINRFNDKLKQERFKKARFGTVRLDKENKPSIHGHFESTTDTNSDFETDAITKNFETYNTVSDPLYSPNTSVNQIQPRHLPSIDSNVTNNRTQFHTEREFQSTQNDNTNRVSFIDDLYLTSEILDDKTNEIPVLTHSPEISDYPDHQRTQNTYSTANKDSFLDELYFSNEIADTKNICNSVENLSKASSCQENMKNTNLKDNSGFTDELYFQNQTVQSTNDDYSNLKPSTASIKEKCFSFIDESYFDNNFINENMDSQKDVEEKADFHASNVKNSPMISNPKENFDFYDVEVNYNAKNEQKDIKYYSKDQFSYSENDQEYENISNCDTNFAHGNQNSKFDSYSSANYNDHNIPLNPAEDNLILQSPNASYRSKDPSSHKCNDEIEVKGNMNDSFKTNLSGNIMKRDHEIIEKNEGYTQNKSDKAIQETKGDEVKSSDEIETAHDFINKLRAEKKQFRPLIKGGKILAPEVKKDSKGFRILSNQVPKLSYFTRDEILTVLRNNVIYSDDDIVVLNKPYNLVMHESKTSKDPCLSQYLDELASQLDNQNKSPKLITVHRIDKETCGCLLLARNEDSAQRLQSLFAQRKIIKTYWIVTIAVPDQLEGVIDIPIAEGSVDKKSRMVLHPNLPSELPYKNHSKHGKRAVTHYKVIATSGNAALVEVQPETGIKHQIRVHFGFGLSCPILGDHKYSHLTKMVPQKLQSDLLQRLEVRQSKVRHIPMHIYARSVAIPQYREGRNLFVMAPMPTHISVNLQRLKFRKK